MYHLLHALYARKERILFLQHPCQNMIINPFLNYWLLSIKIQQITQFQNPPKKFLDLPLHHLVLLKPLDTSARLTLNGIWIDFTEILIFLWKMDSLPPKCGSKMLFFLPSAKGQNLTARSNFDVLVKLHQIWNFSKSMHLCHHLIGNVLKK